MRTQTGAQRRKMRWRGRYAVRCLQSACALVLVSFLGTHPLSAASNGIGKAEKVVLDVRSLMPRGERRLVVNSDVFRNEVVETKDRSATRLVFRDETYLSMGPESKVRIADLPVARDPERPFVVEATSGVFKFVSGRLRSDQYRIETPSATIGVRGTIVWLSISEAGATQVASQTGEVFVCAQGDCVTLTAGKYTQVERGQAPTLPGEVPDSFYSLIRDMTARLMMDGSEGLGAAIQAAALSGLYQAPRSSTRSSARQAFATGAGGFGRSRSGISSRGGASRLQAGSSEAVNEETDEARETDEKPGKSDDSDDGGDDVSDDGFPGTNGPGDVINEDPEPEVVAIPLPATAPMLLFALFLLMLSRRWVAPVRAPRHTRRRR